MRFIFQPSPFHGSHTSFVGVSILESHGKNVINSRYNIIIGTFQPMILSAHPHIYIYIYIYIFNHIYK